MGDENLEILNAGYEFLREAPRHIRAQFAGIPRKALLSEGETLYRFLEAGFSGTAYDFWLPLETYHHLRRVESVQEWAIWRNANSRAQVAPSAFCRATLTRRVYGFKGLVTSAGKKAITSENLMSSSLVWIPGLSTQDFFLRVYSLKDFGGEIGP